MVTEIKCECGCVHSTNLKLEIADNVASFIANYCDNNICNGKILIVGEEVYKNTITAIEAALQKAYKVKRFIYANDTDYDRGVLADLNNDIDECRMIIMCGTEKLSALIKSTTEYTPIISVFSTLNIKAIMTCKSDLTVIDRTALYNAGDREWAGYYGQLMMILLNCLDYKINRKFDKSSQCVYMVNNIEKEIVKIIEIEYDDFDGLKFKNNLTEIIMQTVLWLSMLEKYDFIKTYDVISDNLRLYFPEFSVGEVEGVLSWYIYAKYRVFVKFGKINSLPPCDRINAIEYLSKYIGYDKLPAFAKLKLLNSDELAKRQFIYLEYREDIGDIIEKFVDIFSVAIKNFRRIYKDVGYYLKKEITYKQLANISDCSAGLLREYSLYRHYFELGYLRNGVI